MTVPAVSPVTSKCDVRHEESAAVASVCPNDCGSLRRDADRLRITAKLVETRSGHCVWAERYDRKLQDVFSIQDEIATNIAHELQVVLTETEKQAIAKIPTADVRAYDFYLRGRQFFHRFRRKGFDLARQMFARAIEIDPDYARAYAGIADCSAFLYFYWDSSAVVGDRSPLDSLTTRPGFECNRLSQKRDNCSRTLESNRDFDIHLELSG
ncbi:MAG: hypothetical protein LAO09_12110 [Acidobacteriia bacterium]|nr:hypothetical protein [Terriglobia bacterium]